MTEAEPRSLLHRPRPTTFFARCLTGLDDGTYGTRLAESFLPPDAPYDISYYIAVLLE